MTFRKLEAFVTCWRQWSYWALICGHYKWLRLTTWELTSHSRCSNHLTSMPRWMHSKRSCLSSYIYMSAKYQPNILYTLYIFYHFIFFISSYFVILITLIFSLLSINNYSDLFHVHWDIFRCLKWLKTVQGWGALGQQYHRKRYLIGWLKRKFYLLHWKVSASYLVLEWSSAVPVFNLLSLR